MSKTLPWLEKMKERPNTDGVMLTRQQIIERIAELEQTAQAFGPSSDWRRKAMEEVEILRVIIGDRRVNPAVSWGYRTIGEEATDWLSIRESGQPAAPAQVAEAE